MDVEKIADLAAELKMHGGLNCAQAVSVALKEESGLDEELLKQLSAGFCAGMGNMKATCGALIGVVMVAGAKTGGRGTLRYAKEISEIFESLSGALVCKDLKKITDGKPLCPCEECVRNAIRAYAKVMEAK